jgi:hypothetical protein
MEVLKVDGSGMLIFMPWEYTTSVAVPQSVGTMGFAESVMPCEHTGRSIGLCSKPVPHTESSTSFQAWSSGQFQPECACAQPKTILPFNGIGARKFPPSTPVVAIMVST